MASASLALQSALRQVSGEIDALFDHLLTVPSDPRASLYQAMRHAAIGGGKRLRPLLVFATGKLFGVDRTCLARVGAAVECIHVYSLIHDDLPAMDDDDVRRGKPTVHRAFDEATAREVRIDGDDGPLHRQQLVGPDVDLSANRE